MSVFLFLVSVSGAHFLTRLLQNWNPCCSVFNATANEAGLADKFALEAIESYLKLNGRHSLLSVSCCCQFRMLDCPVFVSPGFCWFCCGFKVPGDGQCLFTALWKQLGFEDDEDKYGPDYSEMAVRYRPYHLRLQIVLCILQCVQVDICPSIPSVRCMFLHCVCWQCARFSGFVGETSYQGGTVHGNRRTVWSYGS